MKRIDHFLPTRIWFGCSVLAAVISGLIFGAKVGRLLHTISSPLINTSQVQVDSSLSFSVPTSTTVGTAGSTQIQINPQGLFLRNIVASVTFDSKLIQIDSVEMIEDACPKAEKPVLDKKAGTLDITCDNPVLGQGQPYNSLATIKYTPLAAGSTLLAFDPNKSEAFGSGDSKKDLLHNTENTILTVLDHM